VGNFDAKPQSLDLRDLGNRNMFEYSQLRDLYSGESPTLFKDQLVVPPFRFYWLSDRGLS
jgi:amylosucrase